MEYTNTNTCAAKLTFNNTLVVMQHQFVLASETTTELEIPNSLTSS